MIYKRELNLNNSDNKMNWKQNYGFEIPDLRDEVIVGNWHHHKEY